MDRKLENYEVEACARAAHEVNRAFCKVLGDDSHKPWDEAPEWQKRSARMGVISHAQGDVTPEQSHQLWLNEKLATGWTHGPVKDEAKKEHPCMVPYSELPPEQRIKDELFTETVRIMTSALWRVPRG